MTAGQLRQLHLNLNLIGPGAHPGAWRWPAADPWCFADVSHYIGLARRAERAKLDSVFVADTPALRPDIATHAQVQGFDPVTLLAAVAAATDSIGLIATMSTTFGTPFDIARRLQSLDVLSRGRTAWNVVVSGSLDAAQNYGLAALPSRDDRYARGEEFVDVVQRLWRSWPPDAVAADRQRGVFAAPGSLPPIEWHGTYFDVRGPITLPPSPQGYPVIFQAGASETGLELAARTADAVFTAAVLLDEAVEVADDLRRRARAHGRSAESIKVVPGLMTVLGSTEAEALARHRALEAATDEHQALVRLGGILQIDPERLELDRPVPVGLLPDDLAAVTASHGHFRALMAFIRTGASARDVLRQVGTGGHRIVTGTPEQVAGQIEQWFRAGAADGFNLMPDVMADGTPPLLDELVPILQRRGLFRMDYSERTLRARFGLPEVTW